MSADKSTSWSYAEDLPAEDEVLLHARERSFVLGVTPIGPGVGAVLHTHSTWGTILSGADLARGSVRIEGYEMLKGLEGITTHDTFVEVPIFANTQDMTELAQRIRHRFAALDWSATRSPCHGFLLSRHGLYSWGRDLAEARRHIEIHEFLFEVVGRTRMLPAAGGPAAQPRQAAQQQHQQQQ